MAQQCIHPMVTATFRFHEELNDFLAPSRRKQEFTVPCARRATAKHMIEALGVPHTEVGLVLVNGEPAGFDYLLRDGDRVAVHPCSEVGCAPRLRDMRFIADAHLGGLAHMLRMLGFDTLYDNHYDDDAIVAIALRDARIVLTRDRELLKRRAVAHGCYVHAVKSAAQLSEVVARFGLAPGIRPFTVCLHCNLPLRPVDKASVLDRLPPRVREHYQRFAVCDACGRVYWEGSHWRNMRGMLEKVLPMEGSGST